MFLQLSTLLFAVQWLSSPWQLGSWKGVAAGAFFLGMVVLSVLPAMFREWGNVKKRLFVYSLLQIICLTLGVVLPGIGQVITIIYNIILIFLPVSFYKFAGTGFMIFFLWLIGLNNILGNSLLTDPRGIWSGDLYFSMTDWVILGVFVLALARTAYHIKISYRNFKEYESMNISYITELAKSPNQSSLLKKLNGDIRQDLGSIKENLSNEIKDGINDTLTEAANSAITNTVVETSNVSSSNIVKSSQEQIINAVGDRFGGAVKLFIGDTHFSNEQLKEKEKKTLVPIFVISAIALVISAFIQPAWQRQAIDDLQTGFTAVAQNDYGTARAIAVKYNNDEKILYNGDVFYLNGLVEEKESPKNAVQYFRNAADWYNNHKSWISQNYHGASLSRLSMMYANDTPPDYYKARNAIEQAVKLEPENREYLDLQTAIREKLAGHEEAENIGFFRRSWNNIRSRF